MFCPRIYSEAIQDPAAEQWDLTEGSPMTHETDQDLIFMSIRAAVFEWNAALPDASAGFFEG